MEYVQDSMTCRELFIKLSQSNEDKEIVRVSNKIGQIIGKLHKNEIIHGDLTTSNVLIKKEHLTADGEIKDDSIYFIDFGLSFISSQLEDKAVDLYVLERALLSTHSNQAEKIFQGIWDSYEKEYGPSAGQVKDRFNEVRLRGRKRTMIG
jgi:TP53 regulating kinase-like protein